MLRQRAEAGPIWALGSMSGTSLDGVDAAMILTDGVQITDFGATGYRAYTEAERAVLRAGLGRWPGEPAVAAAAEVVDRAHLALLSGFDGADLVGFHGQTLAHEPAMRGTHQAGEGAKLAQGLGLPVAWDFRSADVAAGGQGAPLAPVFHFALAQRIGATAPVVFLNLGGVGNLTWIDPEKTSPFDPGAMLAFDTGPANAPINDLMRRRFGVDLDIDGALAAAGIADDRVLARFAAHPYFDQPAPKSLDRDAFAQLTADVATLPDACAAATLAHAAVIGVARGLQLCPAPAVRVLVTGGGRRNPVIMRDLAQTLGCSVAPVEDVGLDGDMLEAQAFGFLAVRCLRGLPISGPSTTAVSVALTGGQIAD
ncbi:anhydro-N-acetylmuramic acid kinase [Pseudoruegeria sp. SK021]|uniref:anhydro-N-acetylmuramic acid kinase n=1 Tax=Pseudoruegeria sp. SK021 TaxID=1933035 RepID=UPI000A220AC7|nr:anhydro-N-acetylmuramic acid kinase [Pseudoruegeria sp. SK021]OSP54325.1 anhydro-N-acetylmuramic acid kinase [Pseudoruegeria sp. SK021]